MIKQENAGNKNLLIYLRLTQKRGRKKNHLLVIKTLVKLAKLMQCSVYDLVS